MIHAVNSATKATSGEWIIACTCGDVWLGASRMDIHTQHARHALAREAMGK